MGKAEKVSISAGDVATLSAGDLEVLLEQKRSAERAAAEALGPLRDAEAAAARAVEAYEKDLADAEEQINDAKKWLAEVSAHRDETAAMLEKLKADHVAATKTIQDATATA
jgi:predicted  nucleic acid-binding Zn-ribbon protein